MKIDPVALVNRLLWISILFSVVSFGDQTDERLDELFAILQGNANAVVQQQTMHTIWKIWYESGRGEIDELIEKGDEAARSGQLERAEQVYTQVIENAPEFSEGWNRRATVRYYRLDYSGSLEDINRTLALEPRHFGAIWGKGMILGLQRDFIGAIQAFEKMLEITPDSQDAIRRIELLKQEMKKEPV